MFCCWKDWIDNVPFGCWYGAFVSMKGRMNFMNFEHATDFAYYPTLGWWGWLDMYLLYPESTGLRLLQRVFRHKGPSLQPQAASVQPNLRVCLCAYVSGNAGREVNWKVCLNSMGTARFEKVFWAVPSHWFFWENQDTFYSAYNELSLSDEIEIITVLYFSFGFLLVPIFVIWEFRWHNRWSTYIPSNHLKPFSGESYQFRCDVWRSINFGFNMIENSWRLKLLGSFRELGFPNPIFNRQVVRFHQMKQRNKNSSAAKFVL